MYFKPHDEIYPHFRKSYKSVFVLGHMVYKAGNWTVNCDSRGHWLSVQNILSTFPFVLQFLSEIML